MNQLLMACILVGVAVLGMTFILNTAANPSDGFGGRDTIGDTVLRTLPPIVDGKQDVYLKATQYGVYSPSYFMVKKGVPVRIHYSADLGAGCGREVLFPEYKVRKLAPSNGEALIEFTPEKAGVFPFHCSMRMFNGKIEVVQ